MIKINNKEFEIKENKLLRDLLEENKIKVNKYGYLIHDLTLKKETKTDTFFELKVNHDYIIEELDFDNSKEIFWHSSAHVLAAAVKRLFPEAKLAIGPAIENGFYYDFDFSFNKQDLIDIEKEAKKIIAENHKFIKEKISKEKARELFKDEPYKLELLEEFDEISIYKLGDFVDLCRGPHLYDTSIIQAFKITKTSGAYWRGNSDNKQLQRIYGISFNDSKKLKQYLHLLEEAEKRDHKKLGKLLDLFSIQEEGPGFPFIHPKGLIILNELIEFWRELHVKQNYLEIKTPIILSKELWLRSGHWDHYKENMYFTKIDDKEYAVKPMNCPGCILFYKTRMHSYKEFPLRISELGLVHRHEMAGVLNGLFRVRCFTQDDAHVFLEQKQEQIEDEIKNIMNLIEQVYSKFGFDYEIELSTRPENSIGSDEIWEIATNALKSALDHMNRKYKINEGDGAFYGPKIDFHLKDALGRRWQCGTIQLDFSMPERFDLNYIGEDGQKHRPVMLHRVIYGSLERFLGILIEHYAGRFPLWLAPVQLRILTVSKSQEEFAKQVYDKFKENKIRVELDSRDETINKKIREAETMKINYIGVIGDKEIKENTITIRHFNKILGSFKIDKFIENMKKEINERI